MSVVVEVLEEALCIKSVFTHNLLETSYYFLYDCAFLISWLLATVISLGASIVQYNINRLFKLFLGENLVDFVRENLPLDVLALFWRLEIFS